MKVCIVTGGTGGHIYPAVALASALKDLYKEADILFIGNNNRMEASEIPALGYAFEGLPARGFNGTIWNKLDALRALWVSRNLARKILSAFKPDVVIGFGGYVTVPVIQAAHQLKVKTFIHEQNAIAGKANLHLARIADAIAVSYPDNLKEFPQGKTRLIGNPRTYALKKLDLDLDPLKALNLDATKPTVLFVMGSLGAESINETIPLLLNELDQRKIQAIYVTGKKHYDQFIQNNDETRYIKIVPYIDQLALMDKVDILVTRGGATTAAEIMVTGCPSIIIPSPYVPNNHQYFNAKALEESGGCILLQEKDLNHNLLMEKLDHLLAHPEIREDMHRRALELGHPNAAENMIAWINEVLGI